MLMENLCAFNKEILDLLNEESVSGARSGSYKFDENVYRECLKGKSIKSHSNFWGGAHT